MELDRPGRTVAVLTQPGQPQQQIAMPVRDLNACLAEELRRLDADEIYGEVITQGLSRARITTRSSDEPGAEDPLDEAMAGADDTGESATVPDETDGAPATSAPGTSPAGDPGSGTRSTGAGERS